MESLNIPAIPAVATQKQVSILIQPITTALKTVWIYIV